MLQHTLVIMDRCVRAAMVVLLGVYKRYLSPMVQVFSQSPLPVCRFYPSCSLYAEEAFKQKTFFRAMYLAVRRVAKCRPGGEHGFDPVV